MYSSKRLANEKASTIDASRRFMNHRINKITTFVIIGKSAAIADAVIVVPLRPDGSVILQRPYKHGGGEVVTEFCAGLVDEGETPLEAAKRELKEETGYTTENFEHLHTVFSNPTGSRMRYHYFLARDVALTDNTNFDEAEQIELVIVPSIQHARILLHDPNTLTTAGMLGALSLIPKS